MFNLATGLVAMAEIGCLSRVTDEEDADYNHTKHGMADLLEEGFFFLDGDSYSDEGSKYGEEDIDEEELAELKTEDDSPFQCHSCTGTGSCNPSCKRDRLSQNLNRKGITQEIRHAVPFAML